MNFNKFQKISIIFFLTVFTLSLFNFLFFSGEILAAEEAKKEAKIDLSCVTNKNAYPWCSEAEKGIAPLVSQFYKIALGLAGASALGVLIYGSILWTLSGAVTSKQDAMEWISGALWGLALLLGAYLILYTINPRLVELTEPDIKAVTVPAPQKTSKQCPMNQRWSENIKGCVSIGLEDIRSIPDIVRSLDQKIYIDDKNKKQQQEENNLSCAYDCKALPPYLQSRTKSGICQDNICSADPKVVENLEKFYEKMGGSNNKNWTITEAWPPDVEHNSLKHYNGKAIDIILKDASPEKIAATIKIAEAAGYKVLNEYAVKTSKAVGSGHLHLELK
jgi:hypothetical protein